MNFKRVICRITIHAKRLVSTYDQNNLEIPFFSGPQAQALKRAKARIEKQKPCTVRWHKGAGADFEGFDGDTADVTYTKSGEIIVETVVPDQSEAKPSE